MATHIKMHMEMEMGMEMGMEMDGYIAKANTNTTNRDSDSDRNTCSPDTPSPTKIPVPTSLSTEDQGAIEEILFSDAGKTRPTLHQQYTKVPISQTVMEVPMNVDQARSLLRTQQLSWSMQLPRQSFVYDSDREEQGHGHAPDSDNEYDQQEPSGSIMLQPRGRSRSRCLPSASKLIRKHYKRQQRGDMQQALMERYKGHKWDACDGDEDRDVRGLKLDVVVIRASAHTSAHANINLQDRVERNRFGLAPCERFMREHTDKCIPGERYAPFFEEQ